MGLSEFASTSHCETMAMSCETHQCYRQGIHLKCISEGTRFLM
jgi:hypothetical protein